MRSALRRNWPEYLIEAAGLALFMMSACVFGSLLESADSPVQRALPSPLLRRLLMGLSMGTTAVVLIYSPWGRRSGAHFNPATTLTFARLGKVDPRDAAGYVVAQLLGGVAGVVVSWAILGRRLAEPPVRFVATVPGDAGLAVAFLTELTLSFLMMTVVLAVSNAPRFARCTGLCAGLLIASFITFVSPLSGMSINPARSLASAVPSQILTALWIYLLAPPLGMLLAAELRLRRAGAERIFCAKLHHTDRHRCVFCEWRVTQGARRHRNGV